MKNRLCVLIIFMGFAGFFSSCDYYEVDIQKEEKEIKEVWKNISEYLAIEIGKTTQVVLTGQ